MPKQIQPNHADHISYYKDDFIKTIFDEGAVAQLKYDGERMLIHINGDKIYCTSRRFSKKTGQYMENQDKIPIVNEIFKEFINQHLGYTVIDCECYSKDWSTVAGILHSLPERAIELQKENPVKFACFDCLYYDGKDLREERYLDRLAYLPKVLQFVKDRNCHPVNIMLVNSKQSVNTLMNFAIEQGFEGIVVKSLQRKYYDKGASLKCKKSETVDVVVVGYQDGRGKYEGQVGALKIGYYEPSTSEFVCISNVNCGTDEDRLDWTNNKDALLHSVIEVKCQEITKKSLRHPVIVRRRPDKTFEMCTKETIFKE